MRPGDFSPGNVDLEFARLDHALGFNEAGGFLPRKRSIRSVPDSGLQRSFNEAGGFLPRKHGLMGSYYTTTGASMRPGDFSPGNIRQPYAGLIACGSLQ